MEDVKRILVLLGKDDDHNFKIMTWAARLGDVMNARLELLHVIDPEVDYESEIAEKGRFITYDSYFSGDELMLTEEDEAEVRMAQVRVDFAVPKELCRVKRGRLLEIVHDVVEKEGIDIVISGIKSHYGVLTSTFSSNAVKLTRTLDCSVLLVPDNATLEIAKGIHILFATDLRKETDVYLERAVTWGRTLQAATFTAVHVVPERSQLTRLWQGVKSMVASEVLPSEMRQNERRAVVKADLRGKLSRLARRHKIGETIKFSSMALEGEVCQELTRAVRRTLANMVIVGKHSFFHIEDVSFGRIPVKKIGEFGVPVLVCPDLYIPEYKRLETDRALWQGVI